jgi:signal transduction histidine kinase
MEEILTIPGLVIFGTLLLVTFALGLFLFVLSYQRKALKQKNEFQALEAEKQMEIFKASINAQETERKRIARNIHDGVGPYLTALKGKNEFYIKRLDNNPEMLENLKEGNKYIDLTVDSIREICHDLTPQLLMVFDIFETLRIFAENISSEKTRFVFTLEKNSSQLKFPEHDSINIYRVYQEVLHNIVKYSGATQVKIICGLNDSGIKISIMHDGAPFSNGDAERLIRNQKGLGLKTIYGRLSILNGSIDYSRIDGIAHTVISINK